MAAVEKLSIFGLLFWLLVYVVLHVLIGKYREQLEKEDKTRPGNPETSKKIKYVNLLFKWFPAIYLICVLLAFYAS